MGKRLLELIIMAYIFRGNFDMDFLKYSIENHSYNSNKNKNYLEQNKYNPPYLKNKFYYNKTFPRGSIDSRKSIKGNEIRAENRRRKIRDKLSGF